MNPLQDDPEPGPLTGSMTILEQRECAYAHIAWQQRQIERQQREAAAAAAEEQRRGSDTPLNEGRKFEAEFWGIVANNGQRPAPVPVEEQPIPESKPLQPWQLRPEQRALLRECGWSDEVIRNHEWRAQIIEEQIEQIQREAPQRELDRKALAAAECQEWLDEIEAAKAAKQEQNEL